MAIDQNATDKSAIQPDGDALIPSDAGQDAPAFRPSWIMHMCAAAVGFSLQFGLNLAELGLPLHRLSELAVLATTVVMLPICLSHIKESALVLFPFAAINTIMLLVFQNQAQISDKWVSLYFTCCIINAFLLASYFKKDHSALMKFCAFQVVGFLLAQLVLLLSTLGVDLKGTGLVTPPPLLTASTRFAIGLMNEKPGGIWVHGNESGHVYAAAGAAFLYFSTYRRRMLPYLAYMGIIVAAFVVTKNRGGMLGPAIGLLILAKGFFHSRDKFLTILMVAVGAMSLVMLTASPDSALSASFEARTSGDNNIDRNVSERIVSNLESVKLVFQYPFGVGFEQKKVILLQEVGVPASHNGFLNLGFQLGVFYLILFIACAIGAILFKRGTYISYLTVFVSCSFLFEDLLNTTSFQYYSAFIISWMCATKMIGRSHSSRLDFSNYDHSQRRRDISVK